ncbi:MAG TPA: SulP family inorganic anion transporter, partial [Verrucomicrobium sp.]|nr:SulP family inorganic anion transporter [Verrucomicrobium sp.]
MATPAADSRLSSNPSATAQSDTRRPRLLVEFSAGLVTSLLGMVYSISCAALVYSGTLAPYLNLGIVSALVTAVVLGLIVAWRSSLPFAVAGPDTRASAILAVSISAVAGQLGLAHTPSALWLTVMFSGISTGVLLYLMGRFRASRFIRFIPYPAVGGFLAGTGWLLLNGGYKVMTGHALLDAPFSQMLSSPSTPVWTAGLAYGVVALIATRRWSHFLILPVLVVSAVTLAYGILGVQGISLATARAQGWFFDLPPPMAPWEPWQALQMDASVVELILRQSGNYLALALVMAITILLSGAGLELKTRRDADLDLELRVNGWGNFLSGLGGGMAGCLSINRTLLNHQAGARTRLAGCLVALVCAGVLFFQLPILPFIPKPLLGGLLLYLGLGLLYEWLVENLTRLSKVDYGIVVVILLAVASFGFLQGIVLGVIIAAISFAVNYSRINVVKHALTGSQHRSNVERSPVADRLLQDRGHEIQIFWLHGYLFFGTANRLLENVRKCMQGAGDKPARYVILDFSRVTGLDSSAVLSFSKMRQTARRHRAVILYSRLTADMARRLGVDEEIIGNDKATVFHDVDRALEWCEDLILDEVGREHTRYNGLMDLLTQQFSSPTMARTFAQYLDRRDVAADTYLCREEEPSTSLFFVESGRISVTVALAGGQQ